MKKDIIILTGDGKGKTTTALGFAIDAISKGKKVFIGQFLKNGDYSEIKTLKKFLKYVTIEQYGSGRFIKNALSKDDINQGKKGYKKIKEILEEKKHELVILDEGNLAIYYKIFSLEDLLELFKIKSDNTTLIITGRNALKETMVNADKVIRMDEVKHYFKKGVQARVGIEK